MSAVYDVIIVPSIHLSVCCACRLYESCL